MEIFCFGDSHTRFFRRVNTLSWARIVRATTPRITAFDYPAASAKGFAAGKASRFAYRKFLGDYRAHVPQFLCLAYGQVDAEVGYYYRKYVKREERTPEADLSAVYAAYVAMAEATIDSRPLVFKGLNPSTLRLEIQLLNYAFRRLVVRISDQPERERIWNDLRENPPTVAEHARINGLANDILRQAVEGAGHRFFDIRSAVEDPEAPGLARWDSVPSNSDVHLTDSFAVRKAHTIALYEVFNGFQPVPAAGAEG